MIALRNVNSMHPSFGPQVGSSSSARFNYEDLILRSISDLSNRITTLGTQQQQMQETMAHNTQLTQQSWCLTSAMQYDVSNVFIHLRLDYQQSQPFQQLLVLCNITNKIRKRTDIAIAFT